MACSRTHSCYAEPGFKTRQAGLPGKRPEDRDYRISTNCSVHRVLSNGWPAYVSGELRGHGQCLLQCRRLPVQKPSRPQHVLNGSLKPQVGLCAQCSLLRVFPSLTLCSLSFSKKVRSLNGSPHQGAVSRGLASYQSPVPLHGGALRSAAPWAVQIVNT